MARHSNSVFPLRVEINVTKNLPRQSRAAESPVVYLLFRLDLHLGGRANSRRDLYLEAEVHVNPDKSVEVLWVEPQYEILRGTQTPLILGIYEDVLRRVLEKDLSLIGVS